MLFSIYMHPPLAQIAQIFGLGFADDTQHYLLLDGCPDFAPMDLDRTLEAMAGCLKESCLKLSLYLGSGAD